MIAPAQGKVVGMARRTGRTIRPFRIAPVLSRPYGTGVLGRCVESDGRSVQGLRDWTGGVLDHDDVTLMAVQLDEHGGAHAE